MDENELWLSFIKSGSVKDYLSYLEYKKEVEKPDENINRCAGDKGKQYRG